MNKKIIGIAFVVIMGAAFFSGCISPENGERAKMLETQPTKTITESNERKIFMGYLDQVNNPNNIQFIYLMSYNGNVVFKSVVMGKTISATKSSEPYERIPAQTSSSEYDDRASRSFAGYIAGTTQLMNPSGMFGHDTPGVIWQDPAGNYYEYHDGTYLISNVPLKIDVPVLRYSNIDTELSRKIGEMKAKLEAGGSLTNEEKEYLLNN